MLHYTALLRNGELASANSLFGPTRIGICPPQNGSRFIGYWLAGESTRDQVKFLLNQIRLQLALQPDAFPPSLKTAHLRYTALTLTITCTRVQNPDKHHTLTPHTHVLINSAASQFHPAYNNPPPPISEGTPCQIGHTSIRV